MKSSEIKGLKIAATSLLLCGSSALICYDTWKCFRTFINNDWLALTYAALIVLTVAFLVLVRGLPRYTGFFSCILIVALEACMLWASSIGFVEPLMKHELTEKNKALLVSYESRISELRADKEAMREALKAVKGQKMNSADVKNKLVKLQSESSGLQAKKDLLLQSSGANETGFAKQKQTQAVVFRVCAGMIQLILLSVLRVLCPIDIRHGNSAKAIVKQSEITERLSDKAFVLNHIDAKCTGKKGGVYTVTDDEGNILGRGKNSRPAWEAARRNIERRAA